MGERLLLGPGKIVFDAARQSLVEGSQRFQESVCFFVRAGLVSARKCSAT